MAVLVRSNGLHGHWDGGGAPTLPCDPRQHACMHVVTDPATTLLAGDDAAVDAGRIRLTVVEPLGTGGMIHYAYALCGALGEAGLEVTLLTSSDYELAALPHTFQVDTRLRLWPHHDPAQATGGATARLRRAVRRAARGVKLVRAWVVVVRALDGRTTDVVQFGTLRFPFESVFLRVLARRGLVLADLCHEPELRERGGLVARLVAAVSGATYARFDAVFVHGTYNREQFCRLHPEAAARTHAIQVGNQGMFELLERGDATVEDGLRRRYGVPVGKRAVVFFGHLVPSKGVDVLVRAQALAYPTTGVPLIVAGYPSKLFDAQGLRSLVHELGMEESVVLDLRYLPNDEVAALMRIATLAVMPYRSASQSGAIQVAYTFGRPVIATAVGGLPEVVDDRRSGLLVAPESPTQLADALIEILAEPGRAEEMGRYALALSRERFTWDVPARQIADVYRSLVGRRRV